MASAVRALGGRNDDQLHITRRITCHVNTGDGGAPVFIESDALVVELASEALKKRRTRMLVGVEEKSLPRKTFTVLKMNGAKTAILTFELGDR